MLQNLTKGKLVEWVVLLVALVALGLSIAAVAKPCSSSFGDYIVQNGNKVRGILGKGDGMCKTPNIEQCGYFTKNMMCAKNFYCPSNNGNCVPKDGSDLNLCDDGIGGGSGPTDCKVGESVCCNDSEECPTAPHGKKIPVKCDFSNGCSACPNQYKGVCSDGKPPCLSNEGDDCGTTEKCCPGLTCLGNSCVKTSPTKPGHLPGGCEEQPCNSNKDCSGYNCGPCIMGMCTSKTTTKGGGKKGTIVGGPGSLPLGLGNIGNVLSPSPGGGKKGTIVGGPGSLPLGLGNIGNVLSPSPGDGKKSSDLPLILGLSGGGLVVVLAIAFLLMKKK